ncbi:MAG: hypothetical protein A3A43_02765 [Candidatus Liptonbacteria bacterium RIFCSPLOWO2_01_FULL_56_20]|uniref:DUF5667 domain-containing protein n=1 Tax=Candidatus Liptonbacteria bacterium RIFCSPLOWO2_01_FULL_56_20 TaxID=1798652 RepID=A0A1G2CHA9_9BACT|nr:MAG: hypothetical protein UY96_C0009G0017 [Parcubacteria group bacterium GW2011_GWB1_56_8]OGY97560.1 MAG: hypothetical protein A2681_00690 [Candidatus Liptonbacteria bacterium RIFCSPHIGHO2_01_FULL_56_18b]OGZ00776.1 MAG: hypothetical protein A3A43_02765 [Candidatus Liptonbacteria bacterium RIFCSPLOWO2_01_FULL_56_20]
MKFYNHFPTPKRTRERVRGIFLSAYTEKFPMAAVPPHGMKWRYFVRGLATGMAAVIVFVGAGVYADQTNVGPQDILYPLKRSTEALSVTLADDADKPALHLKLAERRLDEIKKVEQTDPESDTLAGLKQDLKKEIEYSLSAILPVTAATATASATALTALRHDTPASATVSTTRPSITLSEKYRRKLSSCESLGEFLKTRAAVIGFIASERQKLLAKYMEKCSPDGSMLEPYEEPNPAAEAVPRRDEARAEDDEEEAERGERNQEIQSILDRIRELRRIED